ncbi:hypothetical protein AB0K09_26160 [Streptomyces sp. NPDC049577]|uniref:hypothetical protein n=1 Tax=Streptomyces sp. NPDC049577 TaxID=3155153 RepID=UPI00341C9F55
MAPVLDGLGEKLAEKWMSALAAPGLLFMGAAAAAAVLGHGHALDAGLLRERAGQWAAIAGHWPVVGQVAALAVAVLASVAVGTFVRTCAEEVAVGIWAGEWPRWGDRLAARLLERRVRRWDGVQAEIDGLRRAAEAHVRRDPDRRRIDELAARRDRMVPARPTRPTYTGDRFAVTDSRLRGQYRIDLATCWQPLWLVLPEETRAELRASRARFDAAVAGSVWACCYAVLGCFWWPAAIGSVAAGLAAWRRGRRAAAAHAGLVEAAVDVHLRKLAAEVGVAAPSDAPWEPRLGTLLNRLFRKGA